ncbi:MAG: DinB family protein [Fluviicola sp.]|nr:DinB family protein [Fluviicola sp.]
MSENIQFSIQSLISTRKFMHDFMSNYSYEQLTKIPEGFSNSMLWNFGHAVVVQQLLTYGLSGNEVHLEKSIIHLFKKGATGKEVVSEDEFNSLKIKSLELTKRLSSDYNEISKTPYSPFMTGLNIELNSVDDAIEFNNVHEALHFGVMLSISKLV